MAFEGTLHLSVAPLQRHVESVEKLLSHRKILSDWHDTNYVIRHFIS